MMAGVMIIDPETHRIKDVNQMAAIIIGDPAEKIIGSVCHRYVCPSSKGQCPITDLHQVIDNSERILLNANKEQIPILKTATMIEISGKTFILESFIDIQARKQAEKALFKSEQRYRSLYSSMKEGMLIGELVYSGAGYPIDYVIVDLNQACAKMVETNLDEMIGARASTWYEDGVITNLQVIESVVKTGIPQDYELRLDQLGKVFHVSLSRPDKGQFAAIINDVTDSKKAQKEIERLAYYDTLTGLPNRVLIKDRLQQAMAQADRSRGLVGVLALDLDHFKKINDSLGVGCGDQMLKKIADRLSSHLRQGDSVARMGGDEFVVVLSNIKTQNDIAAAAGKVLDLLCESVSIDDHHLVCTGSLGIAMYPTDADEVDLLLKNADTAMYQAKETGRNLYQFHSPDMNTRAFERLFLDSDLHRAIDRDELEVYYQPQINLEQGDVIGAEALLRWNHKEKGQISPAVFIPLAEESDLIFAIGKWVLDHACQQGQQWREAGHGDLRIAVNLSARQFRSDLPDIVASALQNSGFPPHLLELELTEGLLMDKPEMARVILDQLQDLGVSLSIDDFGTGYSSLSYLKHFPLNRLKIDRSFVKDLSVDSDDATIVEAIIALAHGLRLNVVAEGVETMTQLEFLKAHQCDEVQGFLMARPMTSTNFVEFLQNYTTLRVG
jgi:diguanylate cyclase (GGDEF)-like protein